MALTVIGLAVSATAVTAQTASAAWIQSTPEGGLSTGPSTGWYENPSTGARQLWTKEGFVKEWSAQEWKEWTEQISGYSKNAAETDQTLEDLRNDVIKNTEGVTEGEAEDAGKVILKSREEDAGLGEDTTGGLDAFAEDGGALPLELGSTVLGGVTLGPIAFKLGVDLGNDLDEVFDLPTWELFQEKAHEAAEAKGCHIENSLGPTFGVSGHEKTGPPGNYLQCGGHGLLLKVNEVDVGTYQAREKITGLCSDDKFDTYIPIPGAETVELEGSECGYGEGATQRGVYELYNKQFKEKPLAVPQEGTLSKEVETLNEESGLPAVPKTPTESVKKVPRKSVLPAKKIQKGLEEGDPSEAAPGGITEVEKEAGKEPSAQTPPTAKFIEENSPHLKEHETASPAEPTAPLFTAPHAELELPSFEVLCTKFPFGVPCWMVEVVESFSATGAAPKVDVPIMGSHDVPINLAPVEPVLEILRPIFGLGIVIALVFTFFHFSMGTNGSGGDDD